LFTIWQKQEQKIKPTTQSWRSGSVIGPWALRDNNALQLSLN